VNLDNVYTPVGDKNVPEVKIRGGAYLRPVLRSVIDAHNLQILILNAINHNVRQAREHQFSGSFDPSPVALTREIQQLAASLIVSATRVSATLAAALGSR
jgi:hypothetical protein